MSCIKFCCVVLTIVCVVRTEEVYRCGIRKHSFVQLVHHGWKVEEGDWPWHVGLFKKSGDEFTYACGATLIDRKHVLTTAHCVVNWHTKNPMPAGDLLLHFGQTDRFTKAKHVQVRDISRVHVHPEFSRFQNNIAVLEVRLLVALTDFVIPICLHTHEDRDLWHLEGQRGWITGWGKTQNNTLSRELQSASLPVVSSLQCLQDDRNFFGTFLTETIFCAGDRNGTSPSMGDSGGGMYFFERGRWFLKGILLKARYYRATLMVHTAKFIVCVNVQRYLAWIRDVMENASTANKRISEKECDRFVDLVKKRSNGMCSNARYPHTVSLVYADGEGKCTGVLVNENHVLTVCSCKNDVLRSVPTHIQIADYGNVKLSNFICHPAYKRFSVHHDIAIVKLSSSIQLSYNMIPACLASNRTENLYDTLSNTGYRMSAQTGGKQFFESDANYVLPTEECNRDHEIQSNRLKILPSQLCVINNDTLPASGPGSIGAPLQSVDTRTCVFTVVGVLIGGSNLADIQSEEDRTTEETLGIYSRIAYHLDWIEETVWDEKTEPQHSVASTTEKSSSTTAFIPPTN